MVLTANPSSVNLIGAGSTAEMPLVEEAENLPYVCYGVKRTGNAIISVAL